MKTDFFNKSLGLLLCVFSFTAVAEGDYARGEQKAELCASCHNQDGNSTTPAWSKIAGQHKNYLLKQLHDFKAADKGKRNNAIMLSAVTDLSEQDLEDLAEYFSRQETSKGYADVDKVELGEKLYRGGDLHKGIPACMACHGPTGEGNALANFPKLGLQHAEYLQQQLQDFKEGKRSNDYNNMMSDIAKKMTEEEMSAVSSYIEGLSKGEK